jgi:hypothetical protein
MNWSTLTTPDNRITNLKAVRGSEASSALWIAERVVRIHGEGVYGEVLSNKMGARKKFAYGMEFL